MEKITTSIDQHGRMLIPSKIREKFSIEPGDKVTLEITDNELKVMSVSQVIEEMHEIFTKNQEEEKKSIVDDFIKRKREEYELEENRAVSNDK